mmetsp:Transcript_25286/g.30586  ORF Transcript_25286/g.30586 Transcript_25286/m.30586 type:complete len:384 (+) Transcript_25286:21-1172(+)|eukprot:CAMPEP_0172504578 /NCGR_PEP_ID=MMETSP1066-20121228/180029_1 /TAXON_ID=671091 /ORGANISM="Coscinodiscus wailesii, Strain CCMP2513" /LENGTH=383 /DNA_ID=CAMNT_0013280837 /DNA_START=21 /DNA_END=1172 /DNA_ORIENTATION=+
MGDDEELTIDAAFCRELMYIRLPFYLRRNKKSAYGVVGFIIACILVHLTGNTAPNNASSSSLSSSQQKTTISQLEAMPSSLSQPVGATVASDGDASLPASIDGNYGDTWSSRPLSPGPDVPMFWNVPKAGGNAIKFILSKCYGFILASESGAGHETENLEVVSIGGASFVNVNVVSLPGIAHAQSVNLASSGLADVIFSPHIHEMAESVFTPANKGRMFTILRHPVDRAVSIFYHEQAVNPNFAGMTVKEYFGGGGGVVENNWMTRFLTGKKGGTLTPEDLKMAMEILRRKVLIGLVDEIEESLRRFKSYMGWEEDKNRGESDTGACERQQFLTPSIQTMGEVTRGSEAWNLIVQQNRFDLQVYEYALNLFGEQKGMLDSLTK